VNLPYIVKFSLYTACRSNRANTLIFFNQIFKKAVVDSNESIDELTGFDLCED